MMRQRDLVITGRSYQLRLYKAGKGNEVDSPKASRKERSAPSLGFNLVRPVFDS